MKKPSVKKSPTKKTHASPVKDVTRAISDRNQLILCIQAGGRCEFDGCNKYLFEHHLTYKRFNFAQMAHIVAFSKLGPRGNVTDRPANINDLDNLMLLCHACHKLVDDDPDEYTRETLEAYKKAHEDRIRLLTSAAPDRQTTAVVVTGKVGGQTVKVSPAEIYAAVAPRYSASRTGTLIDLTEWEDGDDEYYTQAANHLRDELERIQKYVMREEGTHHISLFAIAAMPLLMVAGNAISNKVPCDLFQKHRDAQDWTWKTDGELVGYKFHTIREGTDKSKVALVLSLSGRVDPANLPDEVRSDGYVYEITLDGQTPNFEFLRTPNDLTAFRTVYLQALQQINADHGQLERLHLFPAVPAPIALACGRELMRKVHPTIVVHDYDKRRGGYRKILEVNN